MTKLFVSCFLICVCSFAYSQPKEQPKNSFTSEFEKKFWKEMIKKMPQHKKVLKGFKKHQLEIIYSAVSRDETGKPFLTTIRYGDKNSYFYPASTVKLATTAIALETLHEDNLDWLDKSASIVFSDSSSVCDKYYYSNKASEYHRVQLDETLEDIASKYQVDLNKLCSLNGKGPDSKLTPRKLLKLPTGSSYETISDHLKKMLVYSNNVSFNKIYDFVGHERLNRRLQEMGYTDARIIHRLLACDAAQNRVTIPYTLFNYDGTEKLERKERESTFELLNPAKQTKLGKAHYVGNELVKKSRDFGDHNNMPLANTHNILTKLMLPEAYSTAEQFKLSNADYDFIRKYMAIYPREHQYLRNTISDTLPDGFTKYVFVGSSTDDIPENLRSFNIVGQAYGFTTDCAYFVDFNQNIEFFLSIRINTNKNKILGDDRYEYETIAFPIMQDIGQYIYNYESERSKKFITDLSHLEVLFEEQ